MSEIIGGRYVQGGYVRSVIMRPFNHIGPGQNDRFVASSFAKQLAAISKGKAAPVIKVGNLDAKRDFSDVRDIVRAYRLGALRGDGIYNLGAGKSVRVHDVLDLLIEVSGAKVTIENDPARMRPAEVPEFYGIYAKAKRDFGWEPTIPLRDSLRDLYRYWMGVV